MKKLALLCAMLLAACATLRAQNLNINNNVQGDVYVTVYAYQAGSCTMFIDNTVPTLVTAGSTATVNLNLASSWAGSTVPTMPYDLVWATVSRDPSCPGSFGWGSVVGTCWAGGNEYFDEATVGDPGCGFNNNACLTITFTGGPWCSGFAVGDVVLVNFAPAGMNANVDINP